MLGSIKYNLAHLLDFRGRDARPTFWYYVLFLIILDVVGWIIALVPLFTSVMQQAMKAAEAGLPQDQVAAQIAQGMGPGIASIAWYSVVTSLLLSLLTLAAFVRRLHDSGKPGWWAGLALAIKLLTVAMTVRGIGKIDEALQAVGDPAKLEQLQATQNPGQAWLSLLGWAGLLIVIVFGVFDSTKGPNRYGEEPVRF